MAESPNAEDGIPWDGASKGYRTPAKFPSAKLKTFVRDVTGLSGTSERESRLSNLTTALTAVTTPHHQATTSLAEQAPATELTPIIEQPQSFDPEPPEEDHRGPPPDSDPHRLPTPDQNLTPPPSLSPAQRPALSIHLSLTFNDLDFVYQRTYDCSPALDVSDRLCHGLLRRIDHCAFELITRKDLNAKASHRADGQAKPTRFEMKIDLHRKGSVWSKRTHKSHQKEPLTTDGAKDVILSSHRIIGLFMRKHDPDFEWKDGPVRDEGPEGSETTAYRVGAVQPMTCIPRIRFVERTQEFEQSPGFTLDLAVTSRSQRRQPSEWKKTLEVGSSQSTPLNLVVAEALFSDASHALEGALASRRRTIEERHGKCASLGGNCEHYDEDALEVQLKVVNKLGPQFEHLVWTLRSKVAMLSYPDSQDGLDFINSLEAALADAGHTADTAIGSLADFDFKVLQLNGKGWAMDEPMVFALGPEQTRSRRGIQALLDRIMTGVADALRGNGVTIRMSASKRGHVIMDKTLIGRERSTVKKWGSGSPTKARAKVMEKLRLRIEQDINMICKDTCSLDDREEDIPESLPENQDEVSRLNTASSKHDSVADRPPQTPPSMTAANAASTRKLPTFVRKRVMKNLNVNSENVVYRNSWAGETNTSPTSERPVSPTSLRDPRTGTRGLPIMRSATSQEFSELGSGASQVDKDSYALGVEGISASRRTSVQTQAGEVPKRVWKKRSQVTMAQSEADRTSILENTQASLAKDTADESSIAPSTPGMTNGSINSNRSSFALTPRADTSTTGSDIQTTVVDDSKPDDVVSVDVPHRLLKTLQDSAPISKNPQHGHVPSPLHAEDKNTSNDHEKTHSPSSLHKESKPGNGLAPSPELKVRDGSHGIKTEVQPKSTAVDDARAPELPVAESAAKTPSPPQALDKARETLASSEQTPRAVQAPHTTEDVMQQYLRAAGPPRLPFGLGDLDSRFQAPEERIRGPPREAVKTPSDFAETRADLDLDFFDFHSPFFASSPIIGSHFRSLSVMSDTIDETLEEMDSPRGRDSLEDVNMEPPADDEDDRPATSHARNLSFGSAGLVGFRADQRLRRATLRRSFSPSTKSDAGRPARPATAGTSTARAASSAPNLENPKLSPEQGDGADTDAASEQRRRGESPFRRPVVLKRSFSSGMLSKEAPPSLGDLD